MAKGSGTFEGMWTLTKVEETYQGGAKRVKQVWYGSFLECMSIVAYEGWSTTVFDYSRKIIEIPKEDAE